MPLNDLLVNGKGFRANPWHRGTEEQLPISDYTPPPKKNRNTMGNLPSLIQASQLAFMLLLKRDTLSLSRIPNMIQYPQEMRFTFSGRST